MPKSGIVIIIVSLIALLVAGPMMFGGLFIELNWLLQIGKILFTICVFIWLIMFVIFNVGHFKGKYKQMCENDWKNQIW